MRLAFLALVLTGAAWSQALTEAALAAGGGSVGGVAGKKVSDGITAVFTKVGAVADKAAATKETAKEAAKPETILQIGPGTPKTASGRAAAPAVDHSLVPPPPPIRQAAVKPPVVRTPPVVVRIAPEPVAPPPPPPVASPDDLRNLAKGTSRKEVLSLGQPASRITMFDGGHLVEVFHYATRESSIGTVRLSDGSVSSVEVRP